MSGDTVSPANCIPYLLRALAEGYVLEVGRRRWRISPACGRRWTPQMPTARRWCVPCGWQRRIRCMQSFHGKGKLLLSVRFTAFQQTESDGGE